MKTDDALFLGAAAFYIVGAGLVVAGLPYAALPVVIVALLFTARALGVRGMPNGSHRSWGLFHLFFAVLYWTLAAVFDTSFWLNLVILFSAGLFTGLVIQTYRRPPVTLETLPEGRLLELRRLLQDEGKETAISRAQELTGADRDAAERYVEDLEENL